MPEGFRAPDLLAVGATFADRYVVEAVLGQGGMGRVYRVYDRALDEHVALKALTVPDDPAALDRFKREVRLARRITHRNVARTFDLGEHQGVYYLTLELLHGSSLRDHLKRGLPEFSEALRIAGEVADGLAAAHEAGVVHRDLKPQNVHIEPNGRVVLVDFGIARAMQGDPHATQSAIGTPVYMAPEQLLGAELDARADLFAFGILLHLLLSGKLPTWGGSDRDPIARITGKPAELALEGVPAGLVRLVAELLAHDPEQRPKSAHEVAVQVRSYLGAATLIEPEHVTTALPAFAPLPKAGVPVLAVMPFQDRGGEPGLGAALAEELVDTLSRVSGLKVLASRATARFDATAEPDRVGRELGADSIVDGTTVRSGDRVRVTARLIDVSTGFQRWSQRFDGAFADVFTLQEQIAQRVAEALRLELVIRIAEDSVSPEALALYFEGRGKLRSLEFDGVERLERAVALSPTFRPAIAALALGSVRRHFIARHGEGADGAESARDALTRALAVAPDFPETQLAAAIACAQQADYVTSARHLRFALKLAPTFPDAHEYLGMLQCESGLASEGIPRLLTAMKLDPGLSIAPSVVARHYLLHGREAEFAEAIIESDRRAGASSPPSLFTRLRNASWRHDRAAAVEMLPSINPNTGSDVMRIFARCIAGEPLEADAAARVDAWPSHYLLPRFRSLGHQAAAEIYATAGNLEKTLEHVSRSAEIALIDVEWLELCPLLAEVRALPEYAEISRVVRERAKAIWVD